MRRGYEACAIFTSSAMSVKGDSQRISRLSLNSKRPRVARSTYSLGPIIRYKEACNATLLAPRSILFATERDRCSVPLHTVLASSWLFLYSSCSNHHVDVVFYQTGRFLVLLGLVGQQPFTARGAWGSSAKSQEKWPVERSAG